MGDVEITLHLAKIKTLLSDVLSVVPMDIQGDLNGFVDSMNRLKSQWEEMMASDEDRAKASLSGLRKVIARMNSAVEQYELRTTLPRSDEVLCKPLSTLNFAFPHFAQRTLLSNLKKIHKEADNLISTLPPPPESSSTPHNHLSGGISGTEPPPLMLPTDRKVVGLRSTTDKIARWLVEDERKRLQVVSVVGAAGLGKTTLAFEAYHHPKLRGNFQCFAWITITPTFDLEFLFSSMLAQFKESSDVDEMVKQSAKAEAEAEAEEDSNTKQLDKTIEELRRFLKRRRYVLVLDDVYTRDVSEYITSKLPKNQLGRVIITTSLVDVAYTCASSYHYVYHHEPLSSFHALSLFCVKAQLVTHEDLAGVGDERSVIDRCPQYLRGMINDIVRRCSGIPLAIITLAGLVSTKRKKQEKWESIHRKASRLLHSDVLLNVLRIAYDSLPVYLKPCFLYFGLFPENYPVDKKRLIRLWLAEEFVEKGDSETKEDAAERYLKELIQRNLVSVSEVDVDERVRKCSVHGISHATIIAKLGETNFGMQSEGYSLNVQEKSPRLSIHGNINYPPHKVKSNRLFSLMVFRMNSWHKSYMHNIFSGSKLLKVLDLTGAPLKTFPSEIPDLPHLRYLSLSKTKLKKLPRSIGKLKNLLTLNLKGTMVEELPSELLKLKNLHHLLARPQSDQRMGATISFDITGFRGLLRLSLIDVSTRKGTVKELGKLVCLRKLAITNLPSEMGKKFGSSLKKMTQLESLSITPRDNDIIHLNDDLQPPPSLKRLYFHGPVIRIPHWITSCENLAKVRLSLTKMESGSLALLEKLPNLKMLKIEEQAREMENLIFRKGSFQKLRYVYLYNFSRLKEMKIKKEALPNLQKLYMHSCKGLEKLPLGLERLKEFKELHLLDMSKKFVSEPPIMQSGYNHESLIMQSDGESGSLVVVFPSNYSSSSSSLYCNPKRM